MFLAKLILKISVVKLFSDITLAERNILHRIIEYGLQDVHTACCINSVDNSLLSDFQMETVVPFLTINPENHSENTKFCDGYIICSRNISEFSKVLKTFTFVVHKRILLFLEESYLSDSFIEKNIYEKALSLIIIDNFAPLRFRITNSTKINFVANGKSRIIDRQKITSADFKDSWSPKLFETKVGRKIRVSLFHCPPYVYVNDNKFQGIDFDIFQIVARNWPTEFTVEETKLNTRSNFFVKIIENVQMRESDISICGLWERVLLERKIDFSTPYSFTCLTFLVTKPTLLGDLTFLVQPFCSRLWVSIFCTSLVTSIFWCWTASVFNKIRFSSKYTTSSMKNSMRLRTYFLLGLSTLRFPMKSVRIFFSSWTIFCMVIQTYYSAGLTISLRFPKFSKEIKTFEDMVQQNIRWEEPLADIQKWLLETNHSLYQNLAKLYFSGNDVTLMNQRLSTGKYALLVKLVDQKYAMNAEDLDSSERNRLKVVPQCFANFYTVFAFQRNSPFTKIFNEEMMRLLEHGLVRHWEKMYTSTENVGYMRNFFENFNYEVRQPIDFSKLQGGFYFLIFGYLAGGTAFILEFILNRKIHFWKKISIQNGKPKPQPKR